MPIVISRETREVAAAPKLTEEQTDTVWEHIVRAYLNAHPEVLKEKEESA